MNGLITSKHLCGEVIQSFTKLIQCSLFLGEWTALAFYDTLGANFEAAYVCLDKSKRQRSLDG